MDTLTENLVLTVDGWVREGTRALLKAIISGRNRSITAGMRESNGHADAMAHTPNSTDAMVNANSYDTHSDGPNLRSAYNNSGGGGPRELTSHNYLFTTTLEPPAWTLTTQPPPPEDNSIDGGTILGLSFAIIVFGCCMFIYFQLYCRGKSELPPPPFKYTPPSNLPRAHIDRHRERALMETLHSKGCMPTGITGHPKNLKEYKVENQIKRAKRDLVMTEILEATPRRFHDESHIRYCMPVKEAVQYVGHLVEEIPPQEYIAEMKMPTPSVNPALILADAPQQKALMIRDEHDIIEGSEDENEEEQKEKANQSMIKFKSARPSDFQEIEKDDGDGDRAKQGEGSDHDGESGMSIHGATSMTPQQKPAADVEADGVQLPKKGLKRGLTRTYTRVVEPEAEWIDTGVKGHEDEFVVDLNVLKNQVQEMENKEYVRNNKGKVKRKRDHSVRPGAVVCYAAEYAYQHSWKRKLDLSRTKKGRKILFVEFKQWLVKTKARIKEFLMTCGIIKRPRVLREWEKPPEKKERKPWLIEKVAAAGWRKTKQRAKLTKRKTVELKAVIKMKMKKKEKVVLTKKEMKEQWRRRKWEMKMAQVRAKQVNEKVQEPRWKRLKFKILWVWYNWGKVKTAIRNRDLKQLLKASDGSPHLVVPPRAPGEVPLWMKSRLSISAKESALIAVVKEAFQKSRAGNAEKEEKEEGEKGDDNTKSDSNDAGANPTASASILLVSAAPGDFRNPASSTVSGKATTSSKVSPRGSGSSPRSSKKPGATFLSADYGNSDEPTPRAVPTDDLDSPSDDENKNSIGFFRRYSGFSTGSTRRHSDVGSNRLSPSVNLLGRRPSVSVAINGVLSSSIAMLGLAIGRRNSTTGRSSRRSSEVNSCSAPEEKTDEDKIEEDDARFSEDNPLAGLRFGDDDDVDFIAPTRLSVETEEMKQARKARDTLSAFMTTPHPDDDPVRKFKFARVAKATQIKMQNAKKAEQDRLEAEEKERQKLIQLYEQMAREEEVRKEAALQAAKAREAFFAAQWAEEEPDHVRRRRLERDAAAAGSNSNKGKDYWNQDRKSNKPQEEHVYYQGGQLSVRPASGIPGVRAMSPGFVPVQKKRPHTSATRASSPGMLALGDAPKREVFMLTDGIDQSPFAAGDRGADTPPLFPGDPPPPIQPDKVLFYSPPATAQSPGFLPQSEEVEWVLANWQESQARIVQQNRREILRDPAIRQASPADRMKHVGCDPRDLMVTGGANYMPTGTTWHRHYATSIEPRFVGQKYPYWVNQTTGESRWDDASFPSQGDVFIET